MERRHALGGLLVFAGLLAALVLARVLATVFFAVTVAALLTPVRRRLQARGLSAWWASLVATLLGFLAGAAVLAPLVGVVLLRLDAVLAAIDAAPESFVVELFGYAYTVTLAELQALADRLLRSLAGTLVRAVPVLALKLSVFVLLLFALVYHAAAARRAVFGVVPTAYHDVAAALDERVRDTLFAIYVLQAATAAGTFLLALPFFALVGYEVPVSLAVAAAVLQFLPVVGPSVLVAGLAAYHLSVGQAETAAVVFLIGSVVVAWLPDLLVRPRLARETTDLPGSLYFVGFVGGLLSLGTVGVIAGPLVVAVVVEAAGLVTDELNGPEESG